VISGQRQILGLQRNTIYKVHERFSSLGGIGFTISLFINNLAFTDQSLTDSAKVGILIGSVVAGTLGFIVLNAALKRAIKNEPP